MSSTAEMYRRLEWITVLEKAGISLLEEKRLKLEENFPVYTLMGVMDASTYVALNFLLHEYGLDQSEAKRILEACTTIQSEAPQAKRRKVEELCIAPSALGDFRNWQSGGRAPYEFLKAVSTHRYTSTDNRNVHGFPVVLLCKEFGEFEDILAAPLSDDYLAFIPVAVDLMMKMSMFYRDEEKRKSELKQIFAKKFEVGVEAECQSFSTDFCIKEPRTQIVLGNVEVKNELGTGCSANLQQVGYFVHLRKKDQTSYPMLMVSIVGPDYFQIFGAAWKGSRICVDPLTDPLSLLHVPNRPDAIDKVARVLYAMDVTVKKMKETSLHPYFNFNSKLEYLSNLAGKARVWKANMTMDSRSVVVVVKFSKRYGTDVHKLLQDNGMAPVIHHITTLPGGWKAIIMEYIEVNFTEVDDAQQFSDFKAKLSTLLRNNKFVHGDLRSQNVIRCGNGTFKVVDFDWAGKDGEAKYPLDINTNHEWAPNVQAGGIMYHGHDQFQLDKLK